MLDVIIKTKHETIWRMIKLEIKNNDTELTNLEAIYALSIITNSIAETKDPVSLGKYMDLKQISLFQQKLNESTEEMDKAGVHAKEYEDAILTSLFSKLINTIAD